ncbi:cytochrome P450 [Aestuariicoccus sp. MJ-SS9]|uniref:cytochrome P450 n=1 Tax=Aestuariicoccus sp. MJ-SS9 TaxID=3079855 RepID=UPI00290CD5B9|nr:cytochrome P450 [Aestuariicoccus sp. MJ-SS9]MDU8910755.1 cytochrome P450 [Aestuariicoccus sp. MJ-SS9]
MIGLIGNIFTATGRTLAVLGEGLTSLLWLIGKGAAIILAGGDRKAALLAFAQKVPTQRRVFSVLRAFKPNLAVNRVVMKAYDNTGTAVVTRREDCLDLLHRDADFEVVYGTRMRKLTEGENFFLGMQPGWDYTRDTSAMHLAARTTDVAEIVLPRAAALAQEIVAASGGKIDIVPSLTLEVPWDMTDRYFGVGGTRETMQDWTTILFWYLFEDLPADPDLDAKAMSYAAALRGYLDSAIAERKGAPTGAPDLLNRCLALQSADTPGMSDLGIRNNLLGLLIGAIPTISKASCLALDELLNRPDMLRSAHRAAVEGDDEKFANHIWEALRFNPHNPVIYRRAARDAVIAPSTLRELRVKKGQIVFAATLSAMFDRHEIEAPDQFRINRRWEDYIIWGTGMHTCFGAQINRAVIPAILKPLIAQKNLRRAVGPAGQIDSGGTPHPQHFHLEFDT